MDFHAGLVVRSGREDLALAGRDGSVRIDQLGHHTAQGLDTERQRRHVEQQHVLHIAGQHAALDGGAHRHDFVGVHALVRGLAEELLHNLLDRRDSGRTAHEQHFVDVGGLQACILQRLAARLDGSLDQIVAQLFEFGTREGLHQMLRHAAHSRDIRQVDFAGSLVREFNLRLFGGFLQTLERHRILPQVDAVLVTEFLGQPVDDLVVEVITAQVRITVGGLHFEDAVAEFQDGDIERTATEVEHGHLHILVLLVEAVSQCSGRRLVDDSLHVETGDFACLLRRLTLRVAEVSRHGNHGLLHFLAEIILSRLLHLLQHHSADFLRAVELAVDVHTRRVVVATDHLVAHAVRLLGHAVVGLTHETLDREDGLQRVGDCLPLGRITDLPLAVLGERHDRRRGALAFRVDDDGRLVAFHDRYARVRSSKVNTNDFSHN